MTSQIITDWLSSPATLPAKGDVDATLQQWPWFIPGRLMQAAAEHRQSPYSSKALTGIQLYSNEWLPAYNLLVDFTAEPVIRHSAPEAIQAATDDIIPPEPHFRLTAEPLVELTDTPFIQPLYSEDYFRHQGVELEKATGTTETADPDASAEPVKTLMVMMSFAEWLAHFKTKTEKETEEAAEKRALRSMWQQEKLAAALEDEPEEIPEAVFEMAVSSITREDDLASESLALILEKQEKWLHAADMYRRLALKYPAKSTYFASRAETARKHIL